MKFICSKLSLYEAIINVSKAVADKSTIPALEGIKFRLADGILYLTGYDLEIGIKTQIIVKSQDNGQIVINAKLFSEIVKKMPSEEITVDVAENLAVTITGGSTEYTIPSMLADEYPEIPKAEGSDSITISQAVLKNMISQTIFAVAQTDSKPIFKGELFEIENNTFNMVALDGYRLALRTEQTKTDGTFKFVVPAKALSEVAKLLKDEDELVCTITTSKKHIFFDISGYLVISRLLEGEFHNYKGSIPQKSVTEVIIDKKSFISCLERASLLVNERIKSPVRCIFNDGMLKISCITSIGKIFDEIPADISGPMIEIGFDCRYLLDPLKNTADEKVKLQMNGGNLPMKIVPVSSDEYTFLVLPVRLK